MFSGGTFHNILPGTHSKNSAWKHELFHPEPSLGVVSRTFSREGFHLEPIQEFHQEPFCLGKKHFSHSHRYLIKCDPQRGDLKAASSVYQLTQK